MIRSLEKSTNLQRAIRLQFRNKLFPYNKRFLDKRIDAYLSLFYESEVYDTYDLCKDICDVLYSRQSYAVEAWIDVHPLKSEPIYKQLTLF